MIHELRIYHCVPGKLPDLHNRFSTITLNIWERHGIRQAGFWTTIVGSSNQALYYLLEWESLAEREEKWDAFQADPEWIKARAETEKDGAIVARVENHILAPTPYSSRASSRRRAFSAASQCRSYSVLTPGSSAASNTAAATSGSCS